MTPEIYLSAGTLALAGIIWLVRLEGKVMGQRALIAAQDKRADSQEKRLDALQEKHAEMDSRIVNELSKIRECLARMEGRLGFGAHANGSDT